MATFGKLFTIPTDGFVDAQPLYLSGLRSVVSRAMF